MRTNVLIAATLGGVVASLVDIGAAAWINHVPPAVVLRAIARGLIGARAMTGGLAATLLGLALQPLMGALIGAIYGLACVRLPQLVSQWRVAGVGFGVGVFIVMEFVVVPLSAVRKLPRFTPAALAENVAAMLVFGLIVAFAATRATSERP